MSIRNFDHKMSLHLSSPEWQPSWPREKCVNVPYFLVFSLKALRVTHFTHSSAGYLVDTRSTARFLEISSAIMDDVIWSKRLVALISKGNLKEKSHVEYSSLSVDGLAPLGTGASAGAVMTNVDLYMYLNFYSKFINNKSALVQIMDWCLSGDKPLSEPMLRLTDAYMRHSASMS